MGRPRVAIESFYKTKGTIDLNVEFARYVSRWAALRGFRPFAMHLLHTQYLDDTVPAERSLGIALGLEETEDVAEAWFLLRPQDEMSDSPGMLLAYERHLALIGSGSFRKVRVLRFTQDGEYLSGWDGELPQLLPEFEYAEDATLAG